jgi:hypothetical protein
LKSKNPNAVSVCPSNIRWETITDSAFDIDDKKETIKQPVGQGSATYKNPQKKELVFIDYERFLDLQPNAVIKNLELKKPDFIAYDRDKTIFIVNELS